MRNVQNSAPYLTFQNATARRGATVERMLQRALLACAQTSVCPQQTLGTFQHLLSKVCTPVFLFLLSSRPEQPPAFSFPHGFFLSFLLPFSFYYRHRMLCSSKSVLRPPITRSGIYSGTNQSSCLEADPEGCGFYPWLVIVAVSSGPK